MKNNRLILPLFFGLLIVISSVVAEQEVTIVNVYLPIIRSSFHLDVVPFAEGLPFPADPTDMVDPGDGRLFVAMKDGRILIIDQKGNVKPTLLLDIRDKVDDGGFEKGLLGLTIHPNYAQNGYIYVFYNSTIEGQLFSKLTRFTVVNDAAVSNSEMVMLQLMQHEVVHQGGALRFGPQDGYLYVGVGDDSVSPANGRSAYAQSGNKLHGKILRLDVDGGMPYAIPPDNPFVNDPNVVDEIWALGLRNPWRFNFDRLTGDLYIGDVGNERWEEIDFQPAASTGGENYGWPCFEGMDTFASYECGQSNDYVAPFFFYSHNNPNRFHCSVIGGYVYRGALMPELVGHYLFADYCAGRVYSLNRGREGELVVNKWQELDRAWHTFAERSDGELFMSASNSNIIYQIVPQGYEDVEPLNQQPTVNAGADQTIVLPTDSVNLNGIISDDGRPIPPAALMTIWSVISGPGSVSFGDQNDVNTTASFINAGTYILRLTADDSELTAFDDITVKVHPVNQPPVVEAGTNQTIILPNVATLAGTITDDGWPQLPGNVTASWRVDSGPGPVAFGDTAVTTTTASFITAGTYILRLTADDGDLSASDTITITILPENQAPIVDAGVNQTISLPNAALLDGVVSDDGWPQPPGTIATTWSVISGPDPVTFGDQNAVNTTANFISEGLYVLSLAADDGQLSASDTVTIIVSPAPNQPPAVDAGVNETIALPNGILLAGSVNDDGLSNPPGTLTTTWSVDSGPGTVTFGDTAVVTTLAWFITDGTYVLRLTAYDGELSASDTVTITVNPPINQPPNVNAGVDQTIVFPNDVLLTAAVRDDGLPDPPGIVTTTWSVDSGPGTVTFANTAVITTTASFTTTGIYVLRLTADDSEFSTSDTVTITVNLPANQPPDINAEAGQTNTQPNRQWLAQIVLSSVVAAREAEEETAVSIYLPVINSAFDLGITPFAEGLSWPADPTDMTDPGDGRLFVSMIDGRVLIVDQVGNIWPTPLLDIREIVDDIGFEKGLLGLAAHPDYLMNGYIYAFFNSTIDDQLVSKLSRFTVVNDIAAPESEMVMLQMPQQIDVHQGGALRFSPQDGYLYVGVGDDSRFPDNGFEAHAQSGATLLGKILRLDVNSAEPYAIPPDNPFVNDPQFLDEIWALGLRNPWRFNFDRLTGDLYIGDVGNNNWEEIDFQPAASNGGENYGWPCSEGPQPFALLGCGSADDYTAPYFAYGHDLDKYHCSVIGGTVYRGKLMPELIGHYLFTDYCAGTLYSLYTNQEGTLTLRSWQQYDHHWHTFAERSDGELFLGAAQTETIYQLTPLAPFE